MQVGFGLDVDAINNADFPFCKAINKTLEAHRVEQSNPVSKVCATEAVQDTKVVSLVHFH